MSDIKEAARAHFLKRRDLHSIDVPEWGEKLYFKRHPSVEEACQIFSAPNEVAAGKIAFFLMTYRADGTRLFADHERDTWANEYDGILVGTLVGLMQIWNGGTLDEAKKPSETTPSSTT